MYLSIGSLGDFISGIGFLAKAGDAYRLPIPILELLLEAIDPLLELGASEKSDLAESLSVVVLDFFLLFDLSLGLAAAAEKSAASTSSGMIGFFYYFLMALSAIMVTFNLYSRLSSSSKCLSSLGRLDLVAAPLTLPTSGATVAYTVGLIIWLENC